MNEGIFTEIVNISGMPEVDMFASRLNKQIKYFVSWTPDPEAVAVDAFSVSWRGKYSIYAFPPFSLMGQLLQKARQDQANVLLVAPFWVTQNFYTTILEMLTHNPLSEHSIITSNSENTSTSEPTSSHALSYLKKSFESHKLSEKSISIIMVS